MVNGDVAFCGSQSGAEKMWSEMKLPIPMNFNPSDHYLATMSIRDQAEETLKKNQIGKICTTFKYSELGKSVFKESSGREVDESKWAEPMSDYCSLSFQEIEHSVRIGVEDMQQRSDVPDSEHHFFNKFVHSLGEHRKQCSVSQLFSRFRPFKALLLRF